MSVPQASGVAWAANTVVKEPKALLPRIKDQISQKYGSLWMVLYVRLPVFLGNLCHFKIFKQQFWDVLDHLSGSLPFQVLFSSISGGLDWMEAANVFLLLENYLVLGQKHQELRRMFWMCHVPTRGEIVQVSAQLVSCVFICHND